MPKKVLTMVDKILLESELFTDREEPRRSFWKSYQKCKDGVQNNSGDIFVLTYYGVGGIGKSSLLKKLMSEMDAQMENPRYVYYDFDIRQDMTSVLISIRNILSDRYQFSFPLFDLGMHIYDRKTGKDITAPEVKSYADKSPILNLILTATGNIPIVGVVSLLVQVADKGAAIIKSVIDKHKRDINLMESKSPKELYHSLQYFFALDMADNLKGTGEPMVFFLDTYEKLVNEMLFIGEPLNNDIWIRGEEGLVQNIPNVLWVIAGREILKWEQFDPDWADTLEQHLLGHLSQSDAQQFLQKAGIVDSGLQLQLYELTEGLPLFLDMCVKHFQVLVGKNVTPEISDFGNDMSTLTERFVKYMDSSMKDMFYMLSCLEVWDDRMIENLAEKIPEAFSYSAYDKVRDFSFINHGDGSHYYMHQTVRAVLLKQCPESLKNKTSRKMTEYCMDRLTAKDVSIADCEYYLPLLVAYGLWTYTQGEELADFMSEHIHKYINMI